MSCKSGVTDLKTPRFDLRVPNLQIVSGTWHKHYAHSSRFAALCCGLVSENFIHILQGYLAGTKQIADTRLPSAKSNPGGYVGGILPKGPYLPCVSMACRTLLAGYHRCVNASHESAKNGLYNPKRNICGLRCQGKVSWAWRNNVIPENTVGCNYLSLP